MARFFVRKFLPDFQKQVQAATGKDPGYASQMPRGFAGERLLNGNDTVGLVRVISSFPAFYSLPFLDLDTYSKNRPTSKAIRTPFCALAEYPCVDYNPRSKSTSEVDPYDPKESQKQLRYPEKKISGLDRDQLLRGSAVFKELAMRIGDANVSGIFYNLRGAHRSDDTAGRLRWSWIVPGYTPGEDPSPIALRNADVAADGTPPAWTARLVRADDAERRTHVLTVDLHWAEHMFMMETDETQARLRDVLGVTVAAALKAKREPLQVATSGQALAFAKMLRTCFKDFDDPLQIPRNDLMTFSKGYCGDTHGSEGFLENIARRILIDINRPPETGGLPDPEKRRRRSAWVRRRRGSACQPTRRAQCARRTRS